MASVLPFKKTLHNTLSLFLETYKFDFSISNLVKFQKKMEYAKIFINTQSHTIRISSKSKSESNTFVKNSSEDNLNKPLYNSQLRCILTASKVESKFHWGAQYATPTTFLIDRIVEKLSTGGQVGQGCKLKSKEKKKRKIFNTELCQMLLKPRRSQND